MEFQFICKRMLIQEYKLKLTVKQQSAVDTALWQHISVYNTALNKCFLTLSQGRIISAFDLILEFNGHGKKSGLNQDTIAETCKSVHRAFIRWLVPDDSGKCSGKPRRKSFRRKVRSLIFGGASRLSAPKNRRIHIPGLGKVRCNKEEFREGKIKGGRLIKKASGYYFQYVIEATHVQEVIADAPGVGVDPGFSCLLTLSDGTKIENPRELRKSEKRLAQAQRGKNKKLTAKIHEKIKRQKLNRNHQISHDLVKNYSTIAASEDSFKGMQTLFGKSVSEASLGSLLKMISYKAFASKRRYIPVNSAYTTQECSHCGSRDGPTGMAGLGVRDWTCASCGSEHDRDITSARNVWIRARVTPPS